MSYVVDGWVMYAETGILIPAAEIAANTEEFHCRVSRIASLPLVPGLLANGAGNVELPGDGLGGFCSRWRPADLDGDVTVAVDARVQGELVIQPLVG